ncbi:MAG: YdcF family protein [bacterium]|nr:YdcF family protein [bacterium]
MEDWPMPLSWTRFVETLLLPPAGFLWLAVVGLLMLRSRLRRWGVVLLVLSLPALFGLAIPLVGDWLLHTLDRYPPLPADGGALPPAECVLVLGGGIQREAREYGGVDTVSPLGLERIRYGAWLWERVKRPILVSGTSGPPMAEAMRQSFGVPVRWVEAQSRTTQENATFSARLLGDEGIDRVYLVTHFWHMPRAVAAFRRVGLDPVPAPMGFVARGDAERGVWSLLPRGERLAISHLTLHEWVGRGWYRLRYGE